MVLPLKIDQIIRLNTLGNKSLGKLKKRKRWQILLII